MSRRIRRGAGCVLLSLVCLALPITWAAAQHGGKAEGREVRFARGKTSATYQDRVSGSVEVEYELKAEKGQELIVRLVSDRPASAFVKVQGPNSKPLEISCLAASRDLAKQLGLPSEASCFESDQQKLRRNGQTWSVNLPESGAYALSVYKPNGELAVSTYTLTIIVRPSDKETGSALSTIGSASLDVAMRKFIAVLKSRDVEGFFCFSRVRSSFMRTIH